MKWILLRGLVREQRHWLDFPTHFAANVKSADGKTEVLCLDLPGFGSENEGVVPASIDGFVDDVRARFRKLVPGDEKVGLLAVSLGGMVALTWLARHPEDFVGGVVINSSIGNLSPLWHRMQPHNWPRIARAPFMGPRERERMLLGMTRHQGDLDRDADRYAAIAAATVPKKKNFVAQLRAALAVKAPAHIDVPTLVLASVGDNLVSYKCSEAIAQRLSLPLELHHGRGAEAAGHDLPLDAPDWVCGKVNDWLKTLPQTSSSTSSTALSA